MIDSRHLVSSCAQDGHDARETPSGFSYRCGKSAYVVGTGQGGDTPLQRKTSARKNRKILSISAIARQTLQLSS